MSSSSQPALEQIQQTMASTSAFFNSEVFGKRNFDALKEIYTANARILPPASPMVIGLEGIKAYWSNLIESINATSAVLTTIDVKQTGDGLVEIGSATLTAEPPGQATMEIEVKYVVFWQQEDGKWKWDVDIWNQNA